MKLKFSELQSFSDSYLELKDEKMPINIAFQLSQISKAVSECVQFYREKASYYFEQYAEKEGDNYKFTSDGTGIILKPETANEGRQKFKELDSYEFPLEVKKIKLSSLNDLNLSPSTLTGLLPFIEEE